MTLRLPLILLLVCPAILVGCATWRGKASIPSDNEMVLDQLVVSCNFPLPEEHRLLDELRAERSLVSSKLGLPMSNEPIHLYLFSTAEEFKQHATKYFPHIADRRAFFVESDTRLMVYAYWGDRVAEDLRHETAHGYLHAVTTDLPLWLDEGLAEYFEVPRSQRGLNTPHAQSLNAALALNWKPDLRMLEQLKDASDMTQAQYAEAWAWVHWMLETTPERSAFLRGYLEYFRQGSSELTPLSVALRQIQPDCEQQLAAYLASLQPSLQ